MRTSGSVSSIAEPASRGGKKLLGDEQAMTIERARVVSVQRGDVTEYSTVWVEAFQRSTCGDCSASDACGQGVLGRWFARKQRHYSVRCNASQASLLTVGQWVEIGIPDGVLVRAAVLAYLLPVAGMLFAAIAATWFSWVDWVVALCGLLGLYAGFVVGRWWGGRRIAEGATEPVLLGPANA